MQQALLLEENMHHSCYTDLVQESKQFNATERDHGSAWGGVTVPGALPVNDSAAPVTFFFNVK